MKEAIITNIDGYFVEPTLVDDTVTGVFPLYRAVEVEEDEEPHQELYGYQVAVPVPAGLYKPRFDLAAWEAAVEAYDDAMQDYSAAMAAYDPDGEDDPPTRPSPVDLTAFWVEGLTQAEIDAIRNAPRPPTTEDRVDELETENINLMLALTEVYEQKEADKAALEQENINTMLALTEIYEQFLTLQTGGN